ncbi:MAG: hypothetical protein QRY72_00675 [Candidatus Rhabdochlamydia sp.]
MLKLIAALLVLFTVGWLFLNPHDLMPSSFIAGISITLAVCILISLVQIDHQSLSLEEEEKLLWQMKLAEAESQLSQTVNSLHQELHRLSQQSSRSQERCDAYQKLLDIHQTETERLQNLTHVMSEQLIDQERKIRNLSLQKLEPDLFSLMNEHLSCSSSLIKENNVQAEQENKSLNDELKVLKQLVSTVEPAKKSSKIKKGV